MTTQEHPLAKMDVINVWQCTRGVWVMGKGPLCVCGPQVGVDVCGRSAGWLDIIETTIHWHWNPFPLAPLPLQGGAWNCFLCFDVIARPFGHFSPLVGSRIPCVPPPPQLTSFCRSYLFAVNCMEIVRAIEKVEQAQRQSGIVPASLFR